MQTDYLIVGQGLSGTWLSFWLHLAGVNFIVLDEENPNTASRISSGIINPVTGRRMSKTWLADTILPFSFQAYRQIEEYLKAQHIIGDTNTPIISQTPILDFFNAPDRRLDFEKRATQFESYLTWPEHEHDWLPHLNYGFGYGIIDPAYKIQVQALLSSWRQYLLSKNLLLPKTFTLDTLTLKPDGIQWNDITAKAIIFCDGAPAAALPWFTGLPFAINKGEVLIVEIPDLPQEVIYKKTNTLVPLGEHLFWTGSNYNRDYTDDKPTEAFRNETENWIKHFVKHPYTIIEHKAALRPTTLERRPFVGFHPQFPGIGLLNGMGTKGLSLSPFFCKQMADHITHGTPIMPEVQLLQYSRVLKRDTNRT